MPQENGTITLLFKINFDDSSSRFLQLLYLFQSWVQKSNGIGWLEPGPVLFNSDGSSYLTLLPVRDAEAGYFTHVCLIQRDMRQKISLTHGQLTVTNILAWDYENHIV